jgi:hypothetical protein
MAGSSAGERHLTQKVWYLDEGNEAQDSASDLTEEFPSGNLAVSQDRLAVERHPAVTRPLDNEASAGAADKRKERKKKSHTDTDLDMVVARSSHADHGLGAEHRDAAVNVVAEADALGFPGIWPGGQRTSSAGRDNDFFSLEEADLTGLSVGPLNFGLALSEIEVLLEGVPHRKGWAFFRSHIAEEQQPYVNPKRFGRHGRVLELVTYLMTVCKELLEWERILPPGPKVVAFEECACGCGEEEQRRVRTSPD